jgi:hypothetical protein
MMKKAVPLTSPRASIWFVQPIFMMKNLSLDINYTLYMDYTVYIYDEKSWSRDFPHRLYMVCTAYTNDEESSSRDFPYSLWMVYTGHIYNEKFGPETSFTASTRLVYPIYMMKILFQ